MSVLRAHAAALLNLARADTATPPLVVFDGRADTGARPPYALVYIGMRTPSGREVPGMVSLEATSDVIVTTAYWHCVGVDADAARSVAGRVRAALLGVTPVITGRECTPIEHVDGQPTGRDESTGVAWFDQVDVYAFTSIPA